MDYIELANKYRPSKINTLLIGESPPPNGTNYFYKVPEKYPVKSVEIEDDASLPATIFNHYFGRRPISPIEYEKFLKCLQSRHVFLIDIFNEPIKIRNGRKGLIKENVEKLVSTQNLKILKDRIDELVDPKTKIIFLLARNNYLKNLRQSFKDVSFINWKCFRLDITEIIICK
jgi:hypothetical protein